MAIYLLNLNQIFGISDDGLKGLLVPVCVVCGKHSGDGDTIELPIRLRCFDDMDIFIFKWIEKKQHVKHFFQI